MATLQKHNHLISDSDKSFVINPTTRAIENGLNKKLAIMQFDAYSEIFTFEITKTVEGHDMSKVDVVEVHFNNIDAKTKKVSKSSSECTDLTVTDKSMVSCKWTIPPEATLYAGKLSLIVAYKCFDNSGKVSYIFGSDIYTLDVKESVNAGETVIVEYADILKQWKEELYNAGYINASTMQKSIADLSTALEVERQRINQFTALKTGSTTGDAELQDIRIGADGTVYPNAGEAVRTQALKADDAFETAVNAGLADYSSFFSERLTSSNAKECLTQGVTPSQAYYNGVKFEKETQITGVKMLDTFTATQFSVFAFNNADILIDSVINISPKITNGAFRFDEPITVPTGGYMLIRFLDGVFFYKNTGTNNCKEYRPGTGELMNSPIKIGIEYIYLEEHKSIAFKEIKKPSAVHLSDFLMPKFKVNNDICTFVGRWFNYSLESKTYNATNAAGSSIIFRIKGATKLNVGFHAISETKYTPYFAYSIDGTDFVRQKITDTTIPIADTSEHWIWLVVDGMGENDPVAGGKWYGTVGVYFTGITTDGVTHGADFSNRQILFIGDSIVEGINALGVGANADTNSSIGGFAFKTARKLNSMPLMCGYGGTAVLGNSSFHKPIEAVDYNMNGVEVNELFPDLILIEHGYNDGAVIATGAYSELDFETAYETLIKRLTVKYTGIPIVCMIPFKQTLSSRIKAVADKYNHCYIVNTSGWELTYSDSSHLDEEGAEIAALNLSESIIEIFGKEFFIK